MFRTFLLLSCLLSLGITVAFGPLGLLACFGACLVSVVLSARGVEAPRDTLAPTTVAGTML